jgi:hypothetical protein
MILLRAKFHQQGKKMISLFRDFFSRSLMGMISIFLYGILATEATEQE